jgi:hypothetical protein
MRKACLRAGMRERMATRWWMTNGYREEHIQHRGVCLMELTAVMSVHSSEAAPRPVCLVLYAFSSYVAAP